MENREKISLHTTRRVVFANPQHPNAVMLLKLTHSCLPPAAPFKFTLIKAEMDDSGIIEPVRGDCPFARCGFTRQVCDIFGFGKLAGHGMTLMGTDLLRILEEALPARIGGAPGDYQLVEGEGAAQTQVTLRVSPRVRFSSADKVKECFLKELRNFYGGALAARMWSHAEGVDVVIAEPLSTVSGKVLPLHLLGTGVERTYAP